MKRKICVALMLLAVVCFVASSATAGLIIDIKAAAGTPGVSADGKSVVADPGALLTMEIWATVSGTNATITDEKIQTVSGAIQLSGAGALALDASSGNAFGYASPFTESTAAPTVTQQQLGAVTTAATGPMWWRAAAAQVNSVASQQYLLGTFKYTVGDALGSINYLKPGAAVGTLTYTIDGVGKTGLAASGQALLSAGAPCVVTPIPEPATLVLLGMGALALVFVRRRK